MIWYIASLSWITASFTVQQQKNTSEKYLLLGGHGLGTHSVLGLALISERRSLYLALSEVTVMYACGDRKSLSDISHIKSESVGLG